MVGGWLRANLVATEVRARTAKFFFGRNRGQGRRRRGGGGMTRSENNVITIGCVCDGIPLSTWRSQPHKTTIQSRFFLSGAGNPTPDRRGWELRIGNFGSMIASIGRSILPYMMAHPHDDMNISCTSCTSTSEMVETRIRSQRRVVSLVGIDPYI